MRVKVDTAWQQMDLFDESVRPPETAEPVALSEQVNRAFNDALQLQIDGKLSAGHIYNLGRPGMILRSAGIPDLEIEATAAMLFQKSDPAYRIPHPFDLSDLWNLPNAIQDPIMIFDSKTRADSKVILTELKSNGVNFVVALEMNHKKGANKNTIEVNSVRSLYPKDHINDIFSWSKSGLLRYINKEKASTFMSQLRSQFAQKWSKSAEADMLNTIKIFQNPTIGSVTHSDRHTDKIINLPEKVNGKNNFFLSQPPTEASVLPPIEADHRSNMPIDEEVEAARKAAGYGVGSESGDDGVTIIERQLTEQKFLTFMGDRLTGAAVIHDPRDVAFLFKNLESASNEHLFVVGKRADNSYSVLYLGTGTSTAMMVDVPAIAAGLREMGAVEAVMVHNHPGGTLEPSDRDQKTIEDLSALLEKMGIACPYSVIINLDSGKYCVFGDRLWGRVGHRVEDRGGSAPGEVVEPGVFQFDRLKLYAPSDERKAISWPPDVAEFISKHKRGTVPKLQLLVLDVGGVVSRYALLDSTKPLYEVGADIVAEVGKHGSSAVLVSNGQLDMADITKLRRFCNRVGVDFVDVVEVKQDRDIVEAYRSLRASKDWVDDAKLAKVKKNNNCYDNAAALGIREYDNVVAEPDNMGTTQTTNFAMELDLWDGKSNKTFTVGRTSEPLKCIGVMNRDIIWYSSKIMDNLSKHVGMNIDIIKQIPEMLDAPILVLKSKNHASRIVLLGELYDKNGAPVTAILELMPKGMKGILMDFNVIASAYGKDNNPAKFIMESEVLYITEDHKKAANWFHGLGLQLPSFKTNYGPIGNITYSSDKINISGVPFSQLLQNPTVDWSRHPPEALNFVSIHSTPSNVDGNEIRAQKATARINSFQNPTVDGTGHPSDHPNDKIINISEKVNSKNKLFFEEAGDMNYIPTETQETRGHVVEEPTGTVLYASAEAVQLDLFGNYIDSTENLLDITPPLSAESAQQVETDNKTDNHITKKEVDHDRDNTADERRGDRSRGGQERDVHRILGANREEILAGEPTGVLRPVGAGGGFGLGVGRNTIEHGRGDGAANGIGVAPGRSVGDNGSETHIPDAGGGRGLQVDAEHVDSVAPVAPSMGARGLTGDYLLTPGDRVGAGSRGDKFNDNVEAIHLLKTLEREGRYATPEEQSRLVKYTGWGGLSEAFDTRLETKEDKSSTDVAWLKRYNLLRDMVVDGTITEKEYESMRQSTLNAHYTDPNVVAAVWDGVMRMGFKGGSVLEPATGTGLFFGGRPVNLPTPVEMHGVEKDSLSGRIARQLYPSADIQINGYQSVTLPENRYNLVISNVPFAQLKPRDESGLIPELSDGGYALHDFYFLKSLHGVKEGGLVACITSRYTMDKVDTDVRSKIAEKADFVGAIRLPNDAFGQIANTEVVTDIVFLQKRFPGKEMSDLTRRFIDTANVVMTTPEGAETAVPVNSFYIDHPEMVLGTPSLAGSMYSGEEYTVNSSGDLEKQLAGALEFLPKDIMNVMVDDKTDELKDKLAQLEYKYRDLPSGSYFVDDNRTLFQKHPDDGLIIPVHEERQKNEKTGKDRVILSNASIEKMKDMVEIRDCGFKVFQYYRNQDEIQYKKALEELNHRYDRFVEKNGYLHKNLSLIQSDPAASFLQSLETLNIRASVDRRKNDRIYDKAPVFSGLTYAIKEFPDRVETSVQALALSLSRYGAVDIPYMASLVGKDEKEMTAELLAARNIYLDPASHKNGRAVYIPADEYLSGNVREKLRIAEAAAESNPIFKVNIDSLREVMPKTLSFEEIVLKMNNPLIKEEYIQKFIMDAMELEANEVTVKHIGFNGVWDITFPKYGVFDVRANGDHCSGVDIFNRVMNGRPLDMMGTDPETKKPYKKEALTDAVKNRASEIQDRFNSWLVDNPDILNELVHNYNEKFNSFVSRQYKHPDRLVDDSVKVSLPGCALPFPLRPHQADAVWHVMREKNVMLAHSVGAGKTFEMICAGMEKKRLGLCNKPMFVVPDSLINQFASDFRVAYPNANILVADDSMDRNVFVNRAATGNWDGIIIRGRTFQDITMSAESIQNFFDERMDIVRDQLTEAANRDGMRSKTVKKLEVTLQQYDDKLHKMLDKVTSLKGALSFDKLGVDHLFVDEADLYKNLMYYTQMDNIKGLGTATGSTRALDMLLKVRHIQESGGGITFATGTPISNTLVEAYTMQMFLQPDVLEAQGLTAFDEWCRQYGNVSAEQEQTNTGAGWRSVTRLRGVVNVDELLDSLGGCWSIVGHRYLEKAGILYPGVRGEDGKVIPKSGNLPLATHVNLAAPSTPFTKSFVNSLVHREKTMTREKIMQGEDNHLVIINDGQKFAIDPRLVNPDLPDEPNSKLNMVTRLVRDLYKMSEKEGYVTAIYIDKPCSYDKDDKNTVLFDAVKNMRGKLIEMGIKPEEIADVRDFDKPEERQKLFDMVKSGDIRVVFGNTITMGAGVNMQDRLKYMIHMDVPYRPRDIEQRNGRIIRPGNACDEVFIFNAVSKGTIETGMWNSLEIKHDFIEKVMSREIRGIRTLDEDSPFMDVMKLSIDNPLMKEAVEVESRLDELKRLEAAWAAGVTRSKIQIQSLPREIDNVKRVVASIQSGINQRQPEESVKGDNFAIVLDGKTYTKRSDAGGKLLDAINKMATESRYGGMSGAGRDIGTYAGLTLRVEANVYLQQRDLCVVTQGGEKYRMDVEHGANVVGLCTRLHNLVYDGPEKRLKIFEGKVSELEHSLKNANTAVNSTFTFADELKEKSARFQELQTVITEELNKRQADAKYSFDWESLRYMSPDDIAPMVEDFRALHDYSQEPLCPWRDEPFFKDWLNAGNSIEMLDGNAAAIPVAKESVVPKSAGIDSMSPKTTAAQKDASGDNKIDPPRNAGSKTLKTADDIARTIKESHGVCLKEPVIALIEKGIAEKKLDPATTYQLLTATIVGAGYTWRTSGLSTTGHHAEFVKDPSKPPTIGDFVVTYDLSKKTFEAAQIRATGKEVLGATTSFDNLKNRIEEYALNMTIRAHVKTILEPQKNPARLTNVPPSPPAAGCSPTAERRVSMDLC